MAAAGVLLMRVWYETARDGHDFNYSSALMTVWDYWYVPYLFIFGLIALVYYYNLNRLDFPDGERPLTKQRAPKAYTILETLCISRGLTMPTFIVRDHKSYNAYSWGLTPDTYKIVVTSGLLNNLGPAELEAVLAHELTHILTGDTRLLFLTGTLSNIFRTLANLFWPDEEQTDSLLQSSDSSYQASGEEAQSTLWHLVFAIILKLGNLGALLTACFVSRKRIYMADAGAIELTKDPAALARALNSAEAHMWGFNHEHDIKPALFHYRNGRETARHPSIEERLQAIQRYAPYAATTGLRR